VTCTNCGKPLREGASVTENDYLFCNNICRYEWKSKGKPTPFDKGQAAESAGRVAIDDLNFPVEPPGFENRTMRVRMSYWKWPKIFLDGAELIPQKSGLFRRNREYSAMSNFGKQVTIRLRRIPVDMIPILEIDGQKFPIARPLNAWEYVWIGLPLLLLFIGGGIGGVMGAIAAFSNSLLIRRIQHWAPRYILTGATTAMAFVLFLNFISAMTPVYNYFGLRPALASVENQLIADAAEANKRCPYMVDKDTRGDSVIGSPGRIVTYYYTFVNHSKIEFNAGELRKYIAPRLIEHVKTSSETRSMRNNKVTLVYRYADKNGVFLFEVKVGPEQYQS